MQLPMTDYAAGRRSQDLNQMYNNPHLSLSPYSTGNGINYLNGNGQMQYPHMGSTYPSYSTPFIPNQNAQNSLMYMSSPASMSMSYQVQPPRSATIPSQPRTMPQGSYYPSTLHSQSHANQSPRYPSVHEVPLTDTEEQDSYNQDTMRSEPINPPLEGYPNVDDFDHLMQHYVSHLSPKKQDKALIHAKRAANIKAVLIDKKTTSVESAQFRFWVKKMFTLCPNDPSVPPRKRKICHENKPVAIREKLFKILTRAHKQCQHGGRDKTSAQVRRIYSWVPKELISRFVKLCPTCQIRRGTTRSSPPESEKSNDTYMDTQSPTMSPAIHSRRDSLIANQSTQQSPMQLSGFSSTFQQQNRWMTPLQQPERSEDRGPKLDGVVNTMNNIHNQISFEDHTSPHLKAQNPGDMSMTTSTDSMHGVEPNSSPYYHPAIGNMHGYHASNMRYRFKDDHHT